MAAEELKLCCDISPWDLAAECPMPPGALAGPRAVAVTGGTVCPLVSPGAQCVGSFDCDGQIWAMTGWELGMGCLHRCQTLSTLVFKVNHG